MNRCKPRDAGARARGAALHAALAATLALAAAGPAQAAGPAGLEDKALAHWVHYARLHARQPVGANIVVVDDDGLRLWLFDAGGRAFAEVVAWSDAGWPAWPLLPGDPAVHWVLSPRAGPALRAQR